MSVPRYIYQLTHSLTHSLTQWSRILLEKVTGLQLVKKFTTIYGTTMFIAALKSARHLSLSWASSIQSTPPHPTSWRPFLILSSHRHLDLLSGLYPSGFPTTTLSPPPIRSTFPTHLIFLDFMTRTIVGEQYRPYINNTKKYILDRI
jgi:hypothetical protein